MLFNWHKQFARVLKPKWMFVMTKLIGTVFFNQVIHVRFVLFTCSGWSFRGQVSSSFWTRNQARDMNYVAKTLGRRSEKWVYHMNILKEYFQRCDRIHLKLLSKLVIVKTFQNCSENKISVETSEKRVNHFNIHQKEHIQRLIANYPLIFSDVSNDSCCLSWYYSGWRFAHQTTSLSFKYINICCI